MEPAPGPAEIARLHALLESLPESAAVEPGTARAFAAAARSAMQLGRPDDAVALGRAALTLEPNNARAWAVVGDALWSLGQVHDARTAYETAISLDDKDLATAVSCARAQQRDGAPDAARALLSFVLVRSRSEEITKLASELLEALQ
ncbi:MAG: tetratricopeptide repeat protein [Deltaproteobacteria bacterium]|nr:tetratricopeptide repeat protein [Deltaproteobacteria bacterium]